MYIRVAQFKDPPALANADIKTAMECQLGREMFAGEAKRFQIGQFTDMIEAGIEDLVHEDFEANALCGLKKVCRAEADRLNGAARKAYGKKMSDLKFISWSEDNKARVKVLLVCLMDEVEYRTYARIMELTISAMKAVRAPWEKLIYGEQPIPNIESHCKVPRRDQ